MVHKIISNDRFKKRFKINLEQLSTISFSVFAGKGSLKKFSSYTAFTQSLLSRYTQSGACGFFGFSADPFETFFAAAVNSAANVTGILGSRRKELLPGSLKKFSSYTAFTQSRDYNLGALQRLYRCALPKEGVTTSKNPTLELICLK
eukprot:sb/3473758/